HHAVSCSLLSLALSTQKIRGSTLLPVQHHTRGKWSSLSIASDRIARRDSPGYRKAAARVPGDRNCGAGLHRLRGTLISITRRLEGRRAIWVSRGSEFGRQITVDFESDADFHECGSCPVHSYLPTFYTTQQPKLGDV